MNPERYEPPSEEAHAFVCCREPAPPGVPLICDRPKGHTGDHSALLENGGPARCAWSNPPTPAPWLCRIGWHRWSVWSAPRMVARVVVYGGETIKGESPGQERTCLRCGLERARWSE